MARLGRKIGIGMLVLILPAFLYLIFTSHTGKEQERKEMIIVKNKLSQLEKVKEGLELDLDKLKNENFILSSDQEEVKEKIELLRVRLKKEQKDKEVIAERLQARLQELANLKAESEERPRQNEESHPDFEKLKRDYVLLQPQLEESRTANEELKEKIAALSLEILRKEKEVAETVEVGRVDPAASVAPVILAKVLLVNEEFNFISVNLGYKHGLKKGDELLIFRGNKDIGSAFVEKTYDYTLLASFSVTLKESIEAGDTIKLRVE